MADVILSPAEVAEVLFFLDSLAYEYDLIAQDLHSPAERRAYRANAERSRRYAMTLGAQAKAAGSGPVGLAHATFRGIVSDFEWLLEEWYEAMKAMDATDRANYARADARLRKLMGAIRGRAG